MSNGSDYPPQQYDNTVQKFSTDYTYIGCVTNNLSGGAGITFDAADNLYVSNSGSSGSLSNTVLKITPSGVGSKYLVQGNGIRRPKGLAFDSATNLYVASSGNGTIYKFSPTKVRTVFATGLSTPTSIAIYPGLNLWSTKPISWANAGATTNRSFQSEFRNNPGLTLLVRAATNLSQDAAIWDTLTNVVERAPGVYQFTDPCATNADRRFFHIQAP